MWSTFMANFLSLFFSKKTQNLQYPEGVCTPNRFAKCPFESNKVENRVSTLKIENDRQIGVVHTVVLVWEQIRNKSFYEWIDKRKLFIKFFKMFTYSTILNNSQSKF